jgi:hypothetical protein
MANTRAATVAQFAASTAGFLVSAYLVSTVIFDWGPHQNTPPALRIGVSTLALAVALAVAVSVVWWSSRGYRGWKLEGGKLLFLDKVGRARTSVELSAVTLVRALEDDWDVLARAESEEFEQASPGEGAAVHEGELEVSAGNRRYLVVTPSAAAAREAAATIQNSVERARRAG